MEEKNGKRITRWKTGATKLQGAAYLREMAEQGWILEDMNHIVYTFREDTPRYLRYRLEERESVLSEEERKEYAKDDWQEVCHYELEYVFVKERDPFVEEPEVDPQELVDEIDREIVQEKKNIKMYFLFFFGTIFIGFAVLAMSMGASAFNGNTLLLFIVELGPNILILLIGGWLATRRLRKKKEQVMDGDIPAEYTDWRSSRKTTIFLVAVLVVGLGVWVYYTSGFNEKTFDMPSEISYKEIPAVRLENLVDEPLTRTGESIAPDMEGIRLNANIGEGSMYELRKNMGAFENYGVEEKYLLRTSKKMETHQCMLTADGAELNLDTEYYYFRDIQDAGRQYLELCATEEQMDEYWKEQGMDFPSAQRIQIESERIDNLHVCRTDWTDEIAYHVVANKGSQVMELNYSGKDIDVKRLLHETAKAFYAQYYK